MFIFRKVFYEIRKEMNFGGLNFKYVCLKGAEMGETCSAQIGVKKSIRNFYWNT